MLELLYLNKYFYKYRWRLFIGALITIAAILFKVFVPEIVSNIIDTVNRYLASEERDLFRFKEEILKQIGYLIGSTLFAGVLTFFMRQTIINVSRYVEYDLKNEIYQKYQVLSLSFYKTHNTGDLMNRITEDVSRVRMYAGPAIMYSINTISLFAVALSFMFNQAPLLTFYTIAPLPILSFAIYKLSKTIHRRSTTVQKYLSKLSTFTQESFSGISVIKSYGIEARVSERFDRLSAKSKGKQIHLKRAEALFFPLMLLLIGLSSTIAIYVGGLQHIKGEIGLGTIAKFIMYIGMLTWPVATVGWVTSIVQQAEASQKRINEFLKTEPEIENHAKAVSNIKGDIQFKKVSFTYPDTGIKALDGVSFQLQSGQTLAIVGKTGSGKSTVLDLISRLYDISEGKILIDSVSIEQINLYCLRRQIGYVPQDAFLFSDTIYNNIRFGKEGASKEEVVLAAKKACIHRSITAFKDGYETLLGERGVTLSGGQKQRLSIARAIIKDPEILLLDDSLSAVDSETEEQILLNLNLLHSKKTTVIVTHSVSTAKNANLILVMDRGVVVQQGTHERLSSISGHYQDLCRQQLTPIKKE